VKTVAIVQARMGSTRLPGKVMMPVAGMPMIELLLERLSRARAIDIIILATSSRARDDELSSHVEKLGYAVYRGSEDDVLDRYYQAACLHKADTVVRVTGDCPLIDPALVDEVVDAYMNTGVDYASNIDPPTYPDGLDAEVFSFRALERDWKEAFTPYEREHVTPFIRESGYFTVTNVSYSEDYSAERWTVDKPGEMELIQRIFEHFQPRRDFGWREIMELRQQHPDWFSGNRHLPRNQGVN